MNVSAESLAMDAGAERPLADSPLVTVILTVLNGASFLANAIESILTQSLTNLELIVIDDGSTDNTWPIITTYAQQDRRLIAVRNQTNMGTSAALNVGLRLARGQYITRQDGDDLSLPQRLACQVAFLQAHERVVAVGTNAQIIDAQGAPVGMITTPANNEQIQATLLDYMCFCGPTILARYSAMQHAGFYFDENLSYSEDYDLCLRLAEVGEMACLPEPLYLYRQHAASVSVRRRYLQMNRKALALQNALQRRFACAPAPDKWALVGRDFLRAAVLAWMDGNHAGAQEALARAQAADGRLLQNSTQLETILHRYLSRAPFPQAITLGESLFGQLLPQTPELCRLRGRFLAELHVQAAFTLQNTQVRAHIWRAIRYNPRWLGNRGVWRLLLRSSSSQRTKDVRLF